jgi:DNA polymerase alpha subunit A
MVRRDWCPLSKNVGNKVLEEILSGKEREKIVMVLNDYLSDIGEKMKTGNINLAEFVITKQLTKPPSEYSNFSALPHVIVADRLIKNGGKTESELVQNFIGYVICKVPEEETKDGGKVQAKFSFDKSTYSFDEVMQSRGKLVPDFDWYNTNQLLPPITRLIEQVDGIDIDFVA